MTKIVDNLTAIEENIMGELKDFQRATVERIDYLYRNGQNRILVSDEVGLGKTLVARGVIAKFAKLRNDEEDELVKVVYICSNSTIVDQNLNKLRIVSEIEPESSYTSRLSMQHLNIFKQEYDENVLNSYIQLIPLTPETSFNVSNSQGTVHERALMFAILKMVPHLENHISDLERIFRYGVKYWDDVRTYWEIQVDECNKKSGGEYEKYMVDKLLDNFKDIQKLIKLCEKIHGKEFDKKTVKPHVVNFRKIFADISLNRLNPDLIIMDEFQRFRRLLNSDEGSEMEKLTTKFFNSRDVRILMLSATPYKLYSTLDEISEESVDAHYSEFFEVVNFLKNSSEEQDKFQEVWNDYSIKLKELSDDKNSFIQVKSRAEDELFSNICRTERIEEEHLSDIIDSSDVKNSLGVLEDDIVSFMEIQKLLDDIGLNISVPVDYVKSAPYLMSFMNNYQLKKKIEKYFEKHVDEINKIENGTFWLDEHVINEYGEISCSNARLNNLMGHVFDENTANILWMPPSMPYYELCGPFKNCDNMSKTLIFSSWEMVPRVISSLVSYEFERKTVGHLKRHENYFNSRRYPYPRLRFSRGYEDKSSQMSLFTFLYPSKFLIDAYNPIDCLNRKLTLYEIEKELKSKIQIKLDEIPCNDEGIDLRWYYLAPLLFDSQDYVFSWFDEFEKLMMDNENFSGDSLKTHFSKLKEEFNKFSSNEEKLGGKPMDLADVLCDIALASPAVCVYRSYEKELALDSTMDSFISAPTEIANKFIRFMNLPESIAVIDLNFKPTNVRDAHWRNVLKYSKEGNLQAVFDEYVHLLSNGIDTNNEDRIAIINNKFLNAFNFRTTSYDFDTFDSFKSRLLKQDKSRRSIRTHFAASFTKGKSDESDTNRKKSVMDAFNSPFRPFVLASTSIGQEGLDFHNYCRKIVHWNLPSNPIDLEQREGRINRFESLTIRQNVARRYGDNEFNENIWNELFDKARGSEKVGNCSDLIPYWGLSEYDDDIRIERIVPMYPFSIDEIKYDRLIKILSLYRLTLGQARQEEFINYILSSGDVEEKDLNELFINLSPYYKENI